MVASGCTGDPAEPSGGGNFGAAAALRARLQGRAAPAAAAPPRKETVVLPQVDARGRAVPGAFGRDAAGAGGRHISVVARLSRTMSRWCLPTCGRRPQPGMRTAALLQADTLRPVQNPYCQPALWQSCQRWFAVLLLEAWTDSAQYSGDAHLNIRALESLISRRPFKACDAAVHHYVQTRSLVKRKLDRFRHCCSVLPHVSTSLQA